MLSIKNANNQSITDANHIANLNPFRYRGYYYDSESGFYYLMSRYYDPVTHRFLNADGYFQSGNNILDTNMNAYCGNNPIGNIDPNGNCYVDQKTPAGTYIGTYWVVQVPVPGVPGYCNYCRSFNPNGIFYSEQSDIIREPITFCGVTITVYSYQQCCSYTSSPNNYCETVYNRNGNKEFISHHIFGPCDISSSFDTQNYLYAKMSNSSCGLTYSVGSQFSPDSSGTVWEATTCSGNYSVTSGISIEADYVTQIEVAVCVAVFAVCPTAIPYVKKGMECIERFLSNNSSYSPAFG